MPHREIDEYERTVVAIICRLGDLAEILAYEIPADPDRQPTLDEVIKILDGLIDQAQQEVEAE